MQRRESGFRVLDRGVARYAEEGFEGCEVVLGGVEEDCLRVLVDGVGEGEGWVVHCGGWVERGSRGMWDC